MLKTVGLVLGTAGIVVAFAFFMVKISPQKQAPQEKGTALAAIDEEITPSEKTKEYIDASGFSFSYPDDLVIDKKEVTDKITYSSLELTADDVSGLISIHVADTTAQTVDSIIKKNKDLATLQVKEIDLAELDARQYKHNGQLVTIAIDNGVLFTLTAHMQNDESYWELSYAKIIESFGFPQAPAQNAPATTNGGGGEEIIFEGEEIVE